MVTMEGWCPSLSRIGWQVVVPRPSLVALVLSCANGPVTTFWPATPWPRPTAPLNRSASEKEACKYGGSQMPHESSTPYRGPRRWQRPVLVVAVAVALLGSCMAPPILRGLQSKHQQDRAYA